MKVGRILEEGGVTTDFRSVWLFRLIDVGKILLSYRRISRGILCAIIALK